MGTFGVCVRYSQGYSAGVLDRGIQQTTPTGASHGGRGGVLPSSPTQRHSRGRSLGYLRVLPSAPECSRVLPSTAEYCRVLPSTAEYCRVLPSTAEYCRVLPSTAEYCRVLPSTAAEYSRVLPSTAEYCRVLPPNGTPVGAPWGTPKAAAPQGHKGFCEGKRRRSRAEVLTGTARDSRQGYPAGYSRQGCSAGYSAGYSAALLGTLPGGACKVDGLLEDGRVLVARGDLQQRKAKPHCSRGENHFLSGSASKSASRRFLVCGGGDPSLRRL